MLLPPLLHLVAHSRSLKTDACDAVGFLSQTVYLPIIGLVDHRTLKPGDLVGENKDNYLILEKLPTEYDSRVKAMELDEKPTEQYSDIGGLGKQIQELVEAVVLPLTHAEQFKHIGIQPPKGKTTNRAFGESRCLTDWAIACRWACVCVCVCPLQVCCCMGHLARGRH